MISHLRFILCLVNEYKTFLGCHKCALIKTLTEYNWSRFFFHVILCLNIVRLGLAGTQVILVHLLISSNFFILYPGSLGSTILVSIYR